MRRLNAVLNPVVPAKRAVHLAALGLGLGLIAAVAGASVAVAGQRAETPRQVAPDGSSGPDFATRLQTASAADFQLFCAASEGTMDRNACAMLLWDQALAEQTAATPAFCAPNRTPAELETIAQRGRAVVLTSAPGRGSATDAARRAMTAAFPCGAEPKAVPAASLARAADALGATWEQQHGLRARDEAAARRAEAEATTGADYQRMCASRDAGDDGFCAGVLFAAAITEAKSASPAFCAPAFADRAATARFVDDAKAGVAQVRVSTGQSPHEVARAGLVRAYPCRSAEVVRTDASGSVAQMPVTFEYPGVAAIRPGDALHLKLSGGSRDSAFTVPLSPGQPLPDTFELEVFPILFPESQEVVTLTLTAEIRRGAEAATMVAEPVPLRFARGSMATARNLRPNLSFRPA